MKKNIFIYLTFLGLIGLLPSCEKDETRVIMLDSPVTPTIATMPDLTLQRSKGTDTLVFAGTPVDPGFQASATYSLEACATGNEFKDYLVIRTGISDKAMKITVSDLNGLLLKKFPADKASSIDFRIRAQLTVDAGTGSRGTSSNPLAYASPVQTVNVTIYGLPRLDLINSGITQKIESPLGDGKYSGYVKLDATKPFTLKDPDANITYGANGTALQVNGTAISATTSGWHKLAADTKGLTFKLEAYMIGLVGSATPNGWDSPDQKMDYDAVTGTWKKTLTLVAGEFKFRLNDAWVWNLGGTTDNLTQGGNNIAVTAGNYTISLTIINGTTGTYKIVKN
jgi:hypothetical protein